MDAVEDATARDVLIPKICRALQPPAYLGRFPTRASDDDILSCVL